MKYVKVLALCLTWHKSWSYLSHSIIFDLQTIYGSFYARKRVIALQVSWHLNNQILLYPAYQFPQEWLISHTEDNEATMLKKYRLGDNSYAKNMRRICPRHESCIDYFWSLQRETIESTTPILYWSHLHAQGQGIVNIKL